MSSARSFNRPRSLFGLFRAFRRDEKGVAFVEFAFIAPVMLLLLFGTLEISQAVMADRRVTKVSSSIADLVARTKTTTCKEVNNIFEIGDVLMAPYSATDLAVTIHTMTITNNTGTSAVTKWTQWNNRGTAAPVPTLPAGLGKTNDELVVVQVEYPYDSLITKFVLKNRIELTEVFYLKPRNGFVNYAASPC
jgi:Flp pilus assembly protein TadG